MPLGAEVKSIVVVACAAATIVLLRLYVCPSIPARSCATRMPVTLRKRLACHYCGKRLNTTKRQGNKIPCDSCLADNFLDEDNNIIDVPAAEANRILSQLQPTEIESESDVFCKTCLTNQSFYVRALAEYLPDDSDPRYGEFERALPEFKKDLDLRYPRCCAYCEPRVQARIEQANYTAKADHLRRLMHRKHGRRKTPELQLRSLFISAAGSGHALSLILQLLWHALSSQSTNDVAISDISPVRCLRQWPVPAHCVDYASSWVPLSLLIGLLCIWWNPKWQHRLSGREGRLRGLRKYYLVQLLLLSLRFLAWAVIKEAQSLQDYAPAVHTIMLGLLIMLSGYSMFGIIEVDTTPLVDWTQVHTPLVSSNQFQPPSIAFDPIAPAQTGSQFSMQSLAGSTQPTYEPWRPPTPPPTEDDSMDWAPSQQSFAPRPRVPKPKFNQPSPFHGTLPAAPMRGSLNPKNAASAPQKKALGIPPGFFGLSKNKDQGQQNLMDGDQAKSFAPARFFAHEREADTGLENIFDKMFSVRDPLESQMQPGPTMNGQHRNGQFSSLGPQQQQIATFQKPVRSSQPPLSMVTCCIFIVGLAIVASSLCSPEYLYGNTTVAPSNILPYTAVVPAVHIIEKLIHNPNAFPTKVAIPLFEICLAACAFFLTPTDGSSVVPMWNKLVIGAVCFLLLQEIYRFCQLQTLPVSEAAAAHMAQSVYRAEQHTGVVPAVTHESTDSSHPSPLQLQLSQSTFSPSTQQTPQFGHARPQQVQARQQYQMSRFDDYPSSVRKRDSDESIGNASVSSMQTTSTAPGWETPRNENRTYDWQNSNDNRTTPGRTGTTIARGLGGLSLGGDFGVGSGTGIAGPRAQNSGFGLGRNR